MVYGLSYRRSPSLQAQDFNYHCISGITYREGQQRLSNRLRDAASCPGHLFSRWRVHATLDMLFRLSGANQKRKLSSVTFSPRSLDRKKSNLDLFHLQLGLVWEVEQSKSLIGRGKAVASRRSSVSPMFDHHRREVSVLIMDKVGVRGRS